MIRPEILAPAGNFEKMKFAILYGADAVYLAGKSFGMRTASDNFSDEELAEAIEYAHKRGVKVYITVNVMPRPHEEAQLPDYLTYLNSIRPDALIISDIGVFSLAKKYAPDIDLHVSTQANTLNAAACRAWHELGATRIVLARELSLEEIKEIRDNIPAELELEAFVHGAMCVSHSGRCLLSNYFIGRDANRGACAQPCRWEYNAVQTGDFAKESDNPQGEIHALIHETGKPERNFEAVQNEQGTFMFSSNDMCMIEHIPDLVKAGINSFKIEGRVKSAYYTAVTANAYKNELSAYLADPDGYKFNPKSLNEVEGVSHRGYCTGYFYTSPLDNAQIWGEGGYIRDKAFLATVESYDPETKRATLVQRNKVVEGEKAQVISPGKSFEEIRLCDLRDTDGNSIESAPHPKMLYTIAAPFELHPGDIIRGI